MYFVKWFQVFLYDINNSTKLSLFFAPSYIVSTWWSIYKQSKAGLNLEFFFFFWTKELCLTNYLFVTDREKSLIHAFFKVIYFCVLEFMIFMRPNYSLVIWRTRKRKSVTLIWKPLLRSFLSSSQRRLEGFLYYSTLATSRDQTYIVTRRSKQCHDMKCNSSDPGRDEIRRRLNSQHFKMDPVQQEAFTRLGING